MLLIHNVLDKFKAIYRSHSPFIQLLVLFTAFRALAALFLVPGGFLTDAGPDQLYHRDLARLSLGGQYPYLNYWVEYPPIFPWLNVLAYRLSLALPPYHDSLFWYNAILRELMLPFDVGSLCLIYATADSLFHREAALQAAQRFALLFVPLFVFLSWFDTLVLFFLLLSLYGLARSRPALAGIGIGLGFGVKLFPLVALPAAVRAFREPRRLLAVGLAAAVGLVLVFAPFLILAPDYTAALFRALSGIAGWETIWAMLQNNWGYGIVAPIALRHDPTSATWLPPDLTLEPLPWGWITLGFAALGLYLWTRRIDWGNPRQSTAFVGLTFGVMLLYAKGYSPQWALYLAALSLLLLPRLRGLFYALLFSALIVLEWPIAFVLLEGIPGFLTGVILFRTAATLVLTLEFAALVYPDAALLHRITNRLPMVALAASLLTTAVAIGPTLTAYRRVQLAGEPMAPIVETLSSAAPALTTQPTVAERLLPYAPADSVLVLPNHQGNALVDVEEWLSDTATGYSHVWLLEDRASPSYADVNAAIRGWLASHGCIAWQGWYGSIWAERYVFAPPLAERDVHADFENGLELAAAAPPTALTPGGAFCLTLTWQPAEALPADYTLFVHVINPEGQIVAQSDYSPTLPTTTWTPGQTVQTTQGIILPDMLPSEPYTLQIGLYTPGDLARLPLQNGETSLTVSVMQP